MLIKLSHQRPVSPRFYDCKMFLEAYKLGLISYNRALASLQKVTGEYRPNSKLRDMLIAVYTDRITVPVAAMALDTAYYKGDFDA